MGQVDLSIIIPVYNCEDYIPGLFASLLKQTTLAMEVIVVNDGSTDSSLTLLQAIASADPRVVLLDQPNQGSSAARNAGLARARGEWIGFVDADDWIPDDLLSTWLAQAREQQVDVLIGNAFGFRHDPHQEADNRLLHKQPWGQVISGDQWIVHCVNNHEWPHFSWLQLIRKSMIDANKLRFVQGITHEDIVWTTEVALSAKRIGFCDSPCYGYRRNLNSVTQSQSIDKLVFRAQSYVYVVNWLVSMADRQTANPLLSEALLRHAKSESRNLFGLLRKKISHSPVRRELARRVFDNRLHRALFRRCGNFRSWWYAMRFTTLMFLYAR
ncbi:glycosyltransferase [Dickeya fangzhongdai]|uniref:glycosyltransferase n=1 Tax=Dickeya fangzhongdai TaxID=1778540 RepID=UPI0026DF6FC1|nr:glycosyltransferase [Dickeya fangzhongdai]WKV48876.1 glycosyltransferase [Dickeya fangzhongdai]WPD73921.1 glycosyltransferase [Dickeya fangzhongdai]